MTYSHADSSLTGPTGQPQPTPYYMSASHVSAAAHIHPYYYQPTQTSAQTKQPRTGVHYHEGELQLQIIEGSACNRIARAQNPTLSTEKQASAPEQTCLPVDIRTPVKVMAVCGQIGDPSESVPETSDGIAEARPSSCLVATATPLGTQNTGRADVAVCQQKIRTGDPSRGGHERGQLEETKPSKAPPLAETCCAPESPEPVVCEIRMSRSGAGMGSSEGTTAPSRPSSASLSEPEFTCGGSDVPVVINPQSRTEPAVSTLTEQPDTRNLPASDRMRELVGKYLGKRTIQGEPAVGTDSSPLGSARFGRKKLRCDFRVPSVSRGRPELQKEHAALALSNHSSVAEDGDGPGQEPGSNGSRSSSENSKSPAIDSARERHGSTTGSGRHDRPEPRVDMSSVELAAGPQNMASSNFDANPSISSGEEGDVDSSSGNSGSGEVRERRLHQSRTAVRGSSNGVPPAAHEYDGDLLVARRILTLWNATSTAASQDPLSIDAP
jgi:hypothetical protein